MGNPETLKPYATIRPNSPTTLREPGTLLKRMNSTEYAYCCHVLRKLMNDGACVKLVLVPTPVTYNKEKLPELNLICTSYLSHLEERLISSNISFSEFFDYLLQVLDTYKKRCLFDNEPENPYVTQLLLDILDANEFKLMNILSLKDKSNHLLEDMVSTVHEYHRNLQTLDEKNLFHKFLLEEMPYFDVSSFNHSRTDESLSLSPIRSVPPTPHPSPVLNPSLLLPEPTMILSITSRKKRKIEEEPAEDSAETGTTAEDSTETGTVGDKPTDTPLHELTLEDLKQLQIDMEMDFVKDVLLAYEAHKKGTMGTLAKLMYDDPQNIWGVQTLQSTLREIKKGTKVNPNVLGFCVLFLSSNISTIFTESDDAIKILLQRAISYITI